MASDEPAFLCEGVEVSAKYKGAFCEAKIQKVVKCVKCKVTLKDGSKSLIVLDEDIKGLLKVGATVEVKKSDNGPYFEGVINRINDHSLYTVDFDDGDVEVLRRTKLCPKGDRHFTKSNTLDGLPLTHPEHFWTPVIKKVPKPKSSSAANTCSESDSDDESSEEESKSGKLAYNVNHHQDLVGKILCLEVDDRNKKTITVPVLVVLPSADDIQLPSKHHILVKNFKDNKFLTTMINNTKDFTQEAVVRIKDKTLKFVFDKAMQFYEKNELPPSWDRLDLLGYNSDDSSDSSDDEPDEKRDRFVAELYKFMDERGTPINNAPTLDGIDINLSKLFYIVQSLGGYNRVSNQMKWHVVHRKMKLPSSAIPFSQIKIAYKKYLHAFEDLNRKLGCTLVMSNRSRPSAGRSLISFRERDHDPTPKSIRGRRATSAGAKDEEEAVRGRKVTSEKEEEDAVRGRRVASAKDEEDVIRGRRATSGKEEDDAIRRRKATITKEEDVVKTSTDSTSEKSENLPETQKIEPPKGKTPKKLISKKELSVTDHIKQIKKGSMEPVGGKNVKQENEGSDAAKKSKKDGFENESVKKIKKQTIDLGGASKIKLENVESVGLKKSAAKKENCDLDGISSDNPSDQKPETNSKIIKTMLPTKKKKVPTATLR